MENSEINVFRDPEEVAGAFALFLAFWLAMHGDAHVALSGGSTPKLLFRQLAGDYANRIDWNKVHFYWGDERCVPPDHPDSNYGMTRDLLLQHLSMPEANIHRIRGEAEPVEEARRYGREISRRVPADGSGRPVFDMILLGLGDDGHTASIFPGQMDLLNSDEICAVAKHPESGQLRITLTGPVINNAANIVFLVTGNSKAERVRDIIGRTSDRQKYPAAHIQPRQGRTYWFLDTESAALLG